MSARNPFRDPRPERVPYITYFVCALSAALCIGWWGSGGRENTWGSVPAERIWGGEWGGLITTTLLHANPLQGGMNIFHLIFNLLWMVRLGSVAERVLGRLEYAVFLGAAAIVASGVQLALTSRDSIGLSGVVYALFGLAWACRSTISAFELAASKENVNYMIGWFFLCIFLTAVGAWNIGNAAHGAGLVFGGAIGWLFLAKPIAPRYKAMGGVALAILTVLTILSVSYMPWSESWNSWRLNPSIPTPTLSIEGNG